MSNVDLFRFWRESEDLDLEWLISRLRGEVPQTEQMKVGEAFHSALETAELAQMEGLEWPSLGSGEYSFEFACDAVLILPKLRELKVEKEYGDLLVRGRVDGLTGKEIIDYKTCAQFDPGRLLEGYQWRFYLDSMECDCFLWQIFILNECRQPRNYTVREFHQLRQRCYPGMHADCAKLAREYAEFAREYLPEKVVVPF